MPAKWLTELVERDLKKGTRYWGVEGRLWSAENPDAYAGVHNFDGVMVIFDEASGIDDAIWAVTAGFFTENTPNRFWLAFSNPRRNTGYFYETFHSKREFWQTKVVDARTVEGASARISDSLFLGLPPFATAAAATIPVGSAIFTFRCWLGLYSAFNRVRNRHGLLDWFARCYFGFDVLAERFG